MNLLKPIGLARTAVTCEIASAKRWLGCSGDAFQSLNRCQLTTVSGIARIFAMLIVSNCYLWVSRDDANSVAALQMRKEAGRPIAITASWRAAAAAVVVTASILDRRMEL